MGFPILGTTTSFISAPIFAFCGLFIYLENEDKLLGSLFYCLLFSFGFYLLGFYWIPHTLTEFGQIGFPINHIIGVNALFIISPHLFIYTISHHFLSKKVPLNQFGIVIRTILFISIQYLTPQLFSAYPGHSWIKLAPNLGLASIFGEYLFSLISILISFELCFIYKKKSLNKFNWILFIIFIISNFMIKTPLKTNLIDNLSLRIAQANIGNNAKLSAERGLPNSVERVLATYKKLSTAPSEHPLDLIIWPETAYPFSLPENIFEHGHQKMPTVFKKIINKKNASIFTGGYIQKVDHSYANIYNSALLISPSKKTQGYNKNRLLPFGESLPFSEGINQAIHQLVPSISFFAKSSTSTLFNATTAEGINYNFLSFICYEALSPELLRNHINSVNGIPSFLINLTNDSWYGDTSEPEQHLFLSRWRTVEFSLPMVRSANTGISTIINRYGVEEKRTSLDNIEKLDYILGIERKPEKTIFLKWGGLPTVFLSLILILVSILTSRKSLFK